MGTWDVGTFDNDVALDWAWELEKVDDLLVVKKALARANVGQDEYVESGEACEALAACEVIALLKGKRAARTTYPDEIDKWVESHPTSPPQELVESAVQAIERILSPKSGLLELFEESESLDAWRKAVEELRSRVRGRGGLGCGKTRPTRRSASCPSSHERTRSAASFARQ